MIVYVLTQWDDSYRDNPFHGCFSTREKAQAYMDAHPPSGGNEYNDIQEETIDIGYLDKPLESR